MKRLAEQKLLEWKDSDRRKPLTMRGARQVGKTWLVEKFLAPEFDSFVKIDFEKRRDFHSIFSEDLDPVKIIQKLEILTQKITPGKTLLFFDEIQVCPRAIMALRYFYENMPKLHVIAAGSLLEFAFSDISVPVGRVQYLKINPMTFYEYLIAINKNTMADYTLSSPINTSESIHDAIFKELKNYFLVGGMPECVKVYKESNSFLEVFEVQSELIQSFRDDFSKYTPRINPDCLDTVFLNTYKSVGEQIKYTRLDTAFSSQMNHKAFDLLIKSGLVHKILSCDPSGLPLSAKANAKRFKPAALDIGLMQKICQLPPESVLTPENLLAIYQGKLAEQFVAQEILAWQDSEIFYWAREARGSSAEVDLITTKDGKIYPVEIKSGKGGTLKSMHLSLDKYHNFPNGFVLSTHLYSELKEQKLIFLPLYFASHIINRKYKKIA